MGWAKLDDQICWNPKIMAISNDAFAVYIFALTYSAGQLTDGTIPREVYAAGCAVRRANPRKVADELIGVGLWANAEGGYQIHDYLEFNPSAEAANKKSKDRANSGSKGGSKRPSKTEANTQAKPKANASETSKQKAKQNGSNIPSPSPNPSQSRSQGDSPPSPSLEDHFDQFWEAYPVPNGGLPDRKVVFNSWMYQVEDLVTDVRSQDAAAALIQAGLLRYGGFLHESNTQRRFIQQPQNWLKERCYKRSWEHEDEDQDPEWQAMLAGDEQEGAA